jgi:DNA-binding NarL/FixJ family response regulator
MTAKPGAAQKTQVLIIAESADRTAVLRSLLSAEPDLHVIANGPHDSAGYGARGVVVLDVETDGTWAGIVPASRAGLVVLSDNPDLNWITQTIPREPVALLSRDCGREQLLAAIRAVAEGLTVLEPETIESVLRRSPESIALEPGDEELTSRETEVLHMMTAGLTNREIASALGISENTVKFHIASIFGKLGTSTRTETVTEGIRRGLIVL